MSGDPSSVPLPNLESVPGELCGWLTEAIEALGAVERPKLCEVLLCAKDLGLDSQLIRAALARLEREAVAARESEPLLHQALTVRVLTHHGAALEIRREFLRRWFPASRPAGGGFDLVARSIVIGLALDNEELLTPAETARARAWHLRHHPFRSDKLSAWAAYYMARTGHADEARAAAVALLAQRERDGSWGSDVRRTIACAHPLVLGGLCPPAVLDRSLAYVLARFRQGLVVETAPRAQLLRLLQAMGCISAADHIALRERVARHARRVFISYSRRDLDSAVRLADRLRRDGRYEPWLDLDGIELGDEWPERLATAINESDVVLMLVSSHSLASEFFLKEILYATKRRKPILGLFLERISLPDKLDLLLGNIQQVDAKALASPDAVEAAVLAGLARVRDGA